MNNPLISVIIPAYNCADTLPRAIASIANQTYTNLEIIVVDDNSTDSTKDVVERLAKNDRRIRYVKSSFVDPHRYDEKLKRNINAGYSARNEGFKAVKGELVTFQDADDSSFPERIETQLSFLIKHDATHVTFDWMMYREDWVGKKFDVDSYIKDGKADVVDPNELYKLSQTSKGIAYKLLPRFAQKVPFHLKRKRIIHRLFFGTLASYPGTGNSPLFKREVLDKVRFRKLADRVWPSFMGRGADRDFNFQVAETFKNSYVFFIPLYMWRQKRQNDRYASGIEKYIID